MKISIRVKPNARRSEVKSLGVNKYLVSVTAAPVEGKANAAVIELLSDYFHRPKSSMRIIRGETSREKLVEML